MTQDSNMGISPELWRNNIKADLRWISDEARQREVWMPATSYWDHADEVICSLYDDHLFADFIESTEVGLDENQRAKARALKDAVDQLSHEVPGTWTGAWLVDDPRWAHIRKLARDLLAVL